MRGDARLGLVALGFAGGIAAGMLLWSSQIRRSRRDLFSRSPLRRLAALGSLRARPSVETARVLRDYVRWETRPILRRTGETSLRRMELSLE